MQTINEIIRPIVEKAIQTRLSNLEAMPNCPAVMIKNERALLANPLKVVDMIGGDHLVESTEPRKKGLIMHLHGNQNKAVLVASKNPKFRFEVKWMLPHQIGSIK